MRVENPKARCPLPRVGYTQPLRQEGQGVGALRHLPHGARLLVAHPPGDAHNLRGMFEEHAGYFALPQPLHAQTLKILRIKKTFA